MIFECKDTKKIAYAQGQCDFLGCKVQDVECKGGNYSACTPRTRQVVGEVVALGVLATLEARIIREEGRRIEIRVLQEKGRKVLVK